VKKNGKPHHGGREGGAEGQYRKKTVRKKRTDSWGREGRKVRWFGEKTGENLQHTQQEQGAELGSTSEGTKG